MSIRTELRQHFLKTVEAFPANSESGRLRDKHCWLMANKLLLEVTALPRERYFGAELVGEQITQYCKWARGEQF